MGCGDFKSYSIEDFKKKINFAVETVNYSNILQNQNNLFDGLSKGRFLSFLDIPMISFRLVDSNDLGLSFEWANDSVVRENSFHSDLISFKEHSTWFYKKTQDQDSLYILVSFDNEPVDIVRSDVEKEQNGGWNNDCT